jgi:hypothetical protein
MSFAPRRRSTGGRRCCGQFGGDVARTLLAQMNRGSNSDGTAGAQQLRSLIQQAGTRLDDASRCCQHEPVELLATVTAARPLRVGSFGLLIVATGALLRAERLPAAGGWRARLYPEVLLVASGLGLALTLVVAAGFDPPAVVTLGAAELLLALAGGRRCAVQAAHRDALRRRLRAELARHHRRFSPPSQDR